MNTERLMEIVLDMVGPSETPGDSAVHYAGRGIHRLLVGIDPHVDRLSPRSTQRTRRMQRRTVPVLDASQIHSTSIVPKNLHGAGSTRSAVADRLRDEGLDVMTASSALPDRRENR